MATTYPGGIDDFTNPTSTDTLNSISVPHASQHSDLNDAVEAIETTLGVNPQGEAADVVTRLDNIEGGILDINISQVSADAADELVAGTDPGEVDDDAPVTWFKFTIDSVEYGVPAYAIVPTP
jgi:hypothetical protein